MDFTYTCTDCGAVFPSHSIEYRCPICSKDVSGTDSFQKGNFLITYKKEDLIKLKEKKNISIDDFFPYPLVGKNAYPVGNTPIVISDNLCKRYNLPNLFFKNEGTNPSGSFKDRASQLVAAQAMYFNEKRIALASTGNAGSAMACAGAALGLEIILFVPETAPVNKLMQSVLYGAQVIPVKGTYDDAFSLSIAYTDKFGGINRNTAYNPMTTEGKKSFSIELFLQLGHEIPEILYIPVGDGVIYSGIYKGFYDLFEAGFISTLPHLVCVQAEGSAAISNAFIHNTCKTLSRANTKADSISVASPANGRMTLDFIHACKGWTTVVSDEEILSAQLELTKDAGLFAEPAAAAAWAGCKKDIELIKENFGENTSIGILLTGSGFKDMGVFNGRIKIPESIDNSVEAVISRFSK